MGTKEKGIMAEGKTAGIGGRKEGKLGQRKGRRWEIKRIWKKPVDLKVKKIGWKEGTSGSSGEVAWGRIG